MWHYIAVIKLSALLRGVKSKINGDFHCLDYLHLFRTTNKPKPHKEVCENKDVCSVEMPSEDATISEFNNDYKSDKTPFIIYADLECLLEKIDGWKCNPENSSTTK